MWVVGAARRPGLLASRGSLLGLTLLLSACAPQIQINPPQARAAAGSSLQLTAIEIDVSGTVRDVTSRVTWSSSNDAVAAVGAGSTGTPGRVSALTAGRAVISARLSGSTGAMNLAVTSAVLVSIEVTPATPSLPNGLTEKFTATGIYSDNSTQDLTQQLTWASSSPAVATISNAAGASGMATAAGVGTTIISASSGNITGSTTLTVTSAALMSIQVTPPAPGIPKGVSRQFTATGIFSDNSTQNLTTQVTWASSNTAVATISNGAGSQGLASGASTGSTTISAAIGSISGSSSLTVTSASLVSIAVTPANPSIADGLTEQFTATGTYTDNSTQNLTSQVTWASSDTSVATVSNAGGSQGLATSVNPGNTTISGAIGSISGSTTLTVTSASLVSVAVTPANPSIADGLTEQFTATGTYTDNSTQNLTSQVTWASSDTGVATVSNAGGSQGLVSSMSAGGTTISAQIGSISGSTTLTVTSASLVSIAVTPANPGIASGLTDQFVATGTYTDNSTQNLTTQVSWSSSDTSVATISNAGGSQGLASSAAVGSTTISATSGSVSGSTSLTVTSATLVSIAVTPANPSISNGLTEPFTATGTYTDNSTQNLTAQVTWASTNTGVATVGNAGGSQGLASAATVGSTIISATSGTISGSTTLTVTPAMYDIGGTISGLGASGLALTDNGGNALSVSSGATTFTFSTQLVAGASYAVAVSTQPTGETCTVSNGSGTATANVTSVSVSCVPNYTIGGTISGLPVSSVVLANGSATVTVPSGASSWVFPSSFEWGSSYSVTVQTQPAGAYCQVTSGGTGTLTGNVSNVAVTCHYGYGYNYSQSITVNNGQVSGGPLTNFPFLFNTTDANLATTAHGGGVQNANGYDIIFMGLDSTTCNGPSTCTLAYEVQSYNATTGQLVAWVDIPSMNNSTVIYIFYGNNSITTSQANPTSVWNSNYKAVYHAATGTTLSLNDSTSNANDLTNHGGVNETTGIWGGAWSFNGSSKYLTPASPWLGSGTTAFTFELLAYPVQTTYQAIPLSLATSSTYIAELYQNKTTWEFVLDPTASVDTGSVLVNNWNFLFGTWDGSKMRLYLNGSLIAGPTSLTTYPGAATTAAIGALIQGTVQAWFEGSMCEVRISSVALSAGWITTQYNLVYGAYYGTFYTLGSTVTY